MVIRIASERVRERERVRMRSVIPAEIRVNGKIYYPKAKSKGLSTRSITISSKQRHHKKRISISLFCVYTSFACVSHIVCFIYTANEKDWEREGETVSSFNTSSLFLCVFFFSSLLFWYSGCVLKAAIRFIVVAVVVAAVSFFNSRSFRYFNHHFVWIGIYSGNVVYFVVGIIILLYFFFIFVWFCPFSPLHKP